MALSLPESACSVVPEDAAIGVCSAAELQEGLPPLPELERIPPRWHAKRQTDFAIGRIAARRALKKVGIADHALSSGPRGPVWPQGFVGSISHSIGFGIAVVAPRRVTAGIGIDFEVGCSRVTPSFERTVLTEQERQWVGASPGRDWAMVIFCAKEAAYKAMAAVGSGGLGFHDVAFYRAAPGTLNGVLGETVAPFRVRARFADEDGLVIASVEIKDEHFAFRRLSDTLD